MNVTITTYDKIFVSNSKDVINFTIHFIIFKQKFTPTHVITYIILIGREEEQKLLLSK